MDDTQATDWHHQICARTSKNGISMGMVQILDDSSGAAGAAATHEFSIRRARTVNTFPGAK